MLNYGFAFLTSLTIAIAFRGPLRAVAGSGVTGLIGWAGYDVALRLGAPQMLAAFLGALLVGFAGEVLARHFREPAILFVVPGLFPLVPGLMVYGGMLNLARQEFSAAAFVLTRTMFYTGSLAAGLALPATLFRRRTPRNR
jgi:uncharacterized membrane protein YjjB (DUF3815 family)